VENISRNIELALVPYIKYDSSHDYEEKDEIEFDYFNKNPFNMIEEVRIELKNDGSYRFLPENRFQMLLLCYHNLMYWRFKDALRCIKPGKYFHQNSALSQDELENADLIMGMNTSSHPEFIAVFEAIEILVEVNSKLFLTKEKNDKNKLEFTNFLFSLPFLSSYFHLDEFEELNLLDSKRVKIDLSIPLNYNILNDKTKNTTLNEIENQLKSEF
jgi:hypothetical protein